MVYMYAVYSNMGIMLLVIPITHELSKKTGDKVDIYRELINYVNNYLKLVKIRQLCLKVFIYAN